MFDISYRTQSALRMAGLHDRFTINQLSLYVMKVETVSLREQFQKRFDSLPILHPETVSFQKRNYRLLVHSTSEPVVNRLAEQQSHRPCLVKKLASWGQISLTVQMNTTGCGGKKKVARVAIDVRLYFDVPIDSNDIRAIQSAAHSEMEKGAYEELIRIKKLRFPNIYPIDTWHTVQPENFQICQICEAHEANPDTRFAR